LNSEAKKKKKKSAKPGPPVPAGNVKSPIGSNGYHSSPKDQMELIFLQWMPVQRLSHLSHDKITVKLSLSLGNSETYSETIFGKRNYM
jgi:hypothetical protein